MTRERSRSTRREILCAGSATLALPLFAALQTGCIPQQQETGSNAERATKDETEQKLTNNEKGTTSMKIQYLEVVTPEVDVICKSYEDLYGVEFGEPAPNLGNARTAEFSDGSLLGIRAPLRDDEDPVVRPYLLVEDIEGAVAKAKEAGAEIAIPPMELPGYGTFAIFIQGGIDHGLWQNKK